MANEKIFQSRIQLKHDIEENWSKATNFIPKVGEIIIYDIDETNSIARFKIGDGITNINSLPFVSHHEAISYLPQELTEEQKLQAKSNIGAEDEIYILQEGETLDDAPDYVDVVYDSNEESLGFDVGQFATKEDVNEISEAIVDKAEIDEDGIVSFKNAIGEVLFSLDLSDLSSATYGEIQLSSVDVSITEGGSGVFTVKLATAPSGTQTVYLAVSDNTKVSVEPATLTFTTSNYNTEQTVTVTALEDTDEYDDSVLVSLTSKKVEAKVVMITIADDDKPEVITDGLALYVDYRNHTDDTSDTITDSASGLTFSNFSHFGKVDNGIYGKGAYKYLTVAKDDAHSAFVEKMKNGNGFTVEAFGTQIPASFFLPNYRAMISTGSENGFVTEEMIFTGNNTEPTRILKDGTTDYGRLTSDGHITINGNTIDIVLLADRYGVPESDVFVHIVKTFSPDGTIATWINGYKFDNNIVVENFASWDYDTMFADFSLRNNYIGDENKYTSSQRIYNRVLAEDEIRNNMEAEKSKMILTDF